MKKLALIASLMMLGLSGCFIAPNRGHDDGYHNGQDHGGDRKDNRDHGGQDDNHDGSNDRHDQYH